MLAALEKLKDLAARQKTITTLVLSRMLGTLEAEFEDLVPSHYSKVPFKAGKTYFNQAEKLNYFKLTGYLTFLKAWIVEAEKLGWDPGIIKNMRRAFFYTDHVCLQMLAGLNDRVYVGKLMEEARKMSVVVMYSKEATQAYKDTLKLDSIAPVPRGKFWNALVMLDNHLCASCPVWPDDYTECDTYKLFIDQEVDFVQEAPGPGICPYCRYAETDCRLCGRYHKQCEKTRESRLEEGRCRDFIPRKK